MKFTVEIDWLDENETLDEAFQKAVLNQVSEHLVKKLSIDIEKSIQEEAKRHQESIANTINERMNVYMEDFFTRRRTITDKFGDVVKQDVTIAGMMKSACDHFLDEVVGPDGKPLARYGSNGKPRIEYFVEKAVDTNMRYAIERAVENVKKNIEAYVKSTLTTTMGEKLAKAIDLDGMLKGVV